MSEQKKTTSGLVFRGAKVVLPPGKYVDCTFIDCRISGSNIELHDCLFIGFNATSVLTVSDGIDIVISGCRVETMMAAPFTSRLNGPEFILKHKNPWKNLFGNEGEEWKSE